MRLRRSAPLVGLVLAAACATAGSTDSTPRPTTTTTTITTTLAPSTTGPATTAAGTQPSTTTTLPAVPPEQLIYEHWKGSFEYAPGLRIDVHAPDIRSNHPVAVTVHGGGWFAGRLDSMGHLADGLAARGFVVFNATYRTIAQGGSFPGMVEDVACAVAYARAHALDYSTTGNHLTLIGHSAGAHLTSLVAFAPEMFSEPCPGAASGVDAWVGLAGSYDTEVYAFLLQPFFGTAFSEDPGPWMAGNPATYVTTVDPGLDLLFVHGEADELVPVTMSESLFLAADTSGASARLVLVPNAGHGEVNSPRVVGDLISEFVAGSRD